MNKPEKNESVPKKCPQCGVPLSVTALDGLCPACLLKLGATGDTGIQSKASPLFKPPDVEEVVRLFPQLEILAFIGKGGMGAVCKARQPALDRVVALKILLSQAADDPSFAERFNREARALARLNHPNIVAVYEFGQVNRLPFFVMEYVDGLNLRQLERTGTLSPQEALQYAHEAGIVHRDIKPENILLDKKGRVKIADFGIAKIIGREDRDIVITEPNQAIGTPHYMAPEQVEKPQSVDHRADIYSLGVVFYEMLTGELPLGKFAPPSRQVRIDVRLDEVVLRALEKQPEQRYQQVSEVKNDLDTIAATPARVPAAGAASGAEPKELNVPRTGLPEVGARDDKRNVRWKAMGAVLLLALTLLAAGYALSRVLRGKIPFNGPGVSVSTELNSASEEWTSTQTAILNKETGILGAKLPNGALVEFLAVCSGSTNGTSFWRPDGRPMTNGLAEFDGMGLGPTRMPDYGDPVGSLQLRSLLFHGPKRDGFSRGYFDLEFDLDFVHYISSRGGDGGGLVVQNLAFPIAAQVLQMRIGIDSGVWRIISTLDIHKKAYNRPRRAGDPDFNVDWDESLDRDGNASVTLLLNIDHRFCEAEVTAMDTNGIAYHSSGTGSSQSGKTAVYQFDFPKLPIGELMEFQAKVRPVRWIVFPDIALQPKHTVSGTALK